MDSFFSFKEKEETDDIGSISSGFLRSTRCIMLVPGIKIDMDRWSQDYVGHWRNVNDVKISEIVVFAAGCGTKGAMSLGLSGGMLVNFPTLYACWKEREEDHLGAPSAPKTAGCAFFKRPGRHPRSVSVMC